MRPPLLPWHLLAALLACSGDSSSPSPKPPGRGDRLLGLSITTAEDGDFDAALAIAQGSGMQLTSLPLAWDDLETAPGVYDPDPDWLAVANAYYPGQGVRLVLEINPIDTNHWRLPAHLAGLPIDDFMVVDAYKALVDWVFTKVPDLELVDFVIGNEIDATLGEDPDAWARYEAFFAQVAPHARSQRTGLRVGAKITSAGLLGNAAAWAASVNQSSDVVLVTHYPLEPDFTVRPPASIHASFDAIVARYPGRTIHFSELGYPSGALCESSLGLQREFVREAFAAWDTHRQAIELIEFVWMTDVSPAVVDEFRVYYGIDDPVFLEYLGTLGLRTYPGAGAEKPAFTALAQEAHARGW